LKPLGAASFSGLSADDTTATPPLFTEQEPWKAQAQQAQEEEPLYQPATPKRQDQERIHEPWQSYMQEELAYEPWVPKAQEQEPTYEFWEKSAQEQHEYEALELGKQEEVESWQAQLQEPVATTDQTLLATLENLDSGLRSQGFVPLEPNSLSTIAQTQDATPAATPEAAKEVAETPLQEVVPQEEQLSSAFTHLGALDYRHMPAPKSSDAPVQGPSVEQPEEPLWAASLRAVPPPLPAVNVPQKPPFAPARRETAPLLQPAASMQPASEREQTTLTQEAPSQPTRVDVLPGPVFKPEVMPVTPTPAYTPQRESAKVPVARANTAIDNDFELETTMKRPAIRLQAIQAQRFAERPVTVAQPPSQPVAVGARTGEQPSAGKVTGGSTSYKDRLVKGYQHQLVGDYDEAMQEYRVIIRNVPELLGEVVNNIRALLKLAPKYATGYRVLGDAYMRQGEYLQAMDAYNKALNMAKKARS
jgi:tetratricopeptide (TPR) repeat protein